MRGPVRERKWNGRNGGIIFDTKQIFPEWTIAQTGTHDRNE
jgi:hypothetical protein